MLIDNNNTTYYKAKSPIASEKNLFLSPWNNYLVSIVTLYIRN